ncbi:MAG: cellulose biosynthesis cyclic di-GMP-binding regulatory protein BcsB [Pararhodobacter sp.]
MMYRLAQGLAGLAMVLTTTTTAMLLPTGGAFAQPAIIPVPLGGNEQGLDPDVQDRLTAERFAAERARGTQSDLSADPAEFLSPLRPLRASGTAAGTALRFDGESRELDFLLFVPDPGAVRSLRIATRSSINVLPERSQFRVYLNDRFVGSDRLQNVTGFGAVDLPVEQGMMQPGENQVRIELVQYHRIFCGPDASFALWSDVDLAASGAVLDGPPEDSGETGFLLGVAAAAASGTAVEIRGIDGLGAESENWINHVTGLISGAMGGDPIPFRFGNLWAVRDSGRSAARVTFLPADQQRVRFQIAGDGAQVMVIEYRPGAALQPLPAFQTSMAGQRRAGLPRIDTQRPVALSELGFRSTEVRNRYQLIEQRFRLADDFVLLTNAKAELRLDYIYADGLPRGSMLLVHVNGTNVRLLPLRGQADRMIEDFPIRFEARLLRAGANTLGFEVIIPGDPPDLPCPAWESPVLGIGETSTLMVPYSPSMFLPDMHFAFVSLQPQSLLTNEMTARAFDAGEVATLRAALAIGGRDQAHSGHTRLHLLSVDDLGSVPAGGYSFSRHAIEAALIDDTGDGLLAEIGSAGDASRTGGLLDLSHRRDSGAGLTVGWDWLVHGFNGALQWMHPRAGLMLEQWLVQQSGQAILMQLDPSRPQHVWLLRAPGSDVSAIAAAIAAARETGEGPRGQVSVLGEDGQWHNWFAPDRQPALLEPVSVGNLRHVLGNFVSAMPVRYVVGLFFLALVSALVALRLVIATREH